MNRGAWWATVHEVTKNQTQLSDTTEQLTLPLSSQHGNKHLWLIVNIVLNSEQLNAFP